MLTVACVKWGDAYGPEYVNRLYAMLRKHLGRRFQFHCFTDDPAGLHSPVLTRPLPSGVIGWWNKLYLFSREAFPVDGERVLYFDLDTVILRDISALGHCMSDFAALRDFYRPRGIGSGVMLWDTGAVREFWEQWQVEGCPSFAGGDQAWIEIMAHRKWGHHILAHRVLQFLHPGTFVSYKADCLDGPPKDGRVVCFHGQPKPHNCGAAWVADAWSETAQARGAAAFA